MIARITLDVVQGPARPIALILIGMFVGMVVLEGGILALFGMRPVGKAFTSSFLVNMAACGVGFVLWMVLTTAGWEGSLAAIGLFAGVVATQGLVLSKNAANLSSGRVWLAALAMKGSSLLVLIGLLQIIDL